MISKMVVGIGMFIFLPISSVGATPMTWGDDIVKPPAWPKSSTINIFIQADPKGQGRDQLLKEGIERWKQTLADRMVTLNVTIGNPPADSVNPVTYTWQADGFKSGDLELGAGKNDGIAEASSDGEKITGGQAFIRNALPSGNDDEKNFLRNLGEHELTHILGLADDDNGVVTNHTQGSGARTYNDQDKKEINTLYGTAASGGSDKPKGNATKTGGGAGAGFFQYSFDFDTSVIQFNPDDPVHISLITLGISPELITGIDLPPGWIALIPNGPVTINDPFFSEGYMIDGAGTLPPWDPTQPISYIALRTSLAEALHDGLPSGFDPALSFENLSFDIVLHTISNVQEGEIEIWAGGELQRMIGPKPVPEPMTFLLFGLSALGGIFMRKTTRLILK